MQLRTVSSLATILVAAVSATTGCMGVSEDAEAELSRLDTLLQYEEQGGLVSIEAEDFTGLAPGSGNAAGSAWSSTTARSGFSGSAALVAAPVRGVNTGNHANGPKLDYEFQAAAAGTYYVWVRLWGANGNEDSVHVGLNGHAVSLSGYGVTNSTNRWAWESTVNGRRLTVHVPRAGRHTFNVWMREDGVVLDKLVLTRNAGYTPSGRGPAATALVEAPTGSITREVWENISGTAVADIPTGRAPNRVTSERSFEAPTNVGDRYGQRMRGYLVPPQTGNYTFWIAGDDNVELRLSGDQNPDRAQRIAWHAGWTSSRQWTKYASQRSRAIYLVAGRRYYIEALMKEQAGGDNLAVGWLRPGQSGQQPSQVIPGTVLAPYALSQDGGGSGGSTGGSAGGDGNAGTGGTSGGGGTCFRARRLWFDDFETGDYRRWTSDRYVSSMQQGGCWQSGFSTQRSVSGNRSHRVSVGCASPSNHRIYSGIQFSGDTPLTRYTNSGIGIEAPNGVVTTYWTWLDAPGFGGGRWYSFFTVDNSCSWQDDVVTLGLEDSTHRITPAHIFSTGGTVRWAPNAPAFPYRQWVRHTVYLNYHTGAMHVWQNGRRVNSSTFRRNSRQICQFHWGLYAHGSNTNVTLFEDDISVWKLEQPWADFEVEPWMERQQTCR